MQIAIVGGSLAGAFLALQLRDSGHRISIFDPRAPWEKPCGGGVYADMLRQFPTLGELPCSWHCPSRLRLISSAREGDFLWGLGSTWLIVSRYDLDRAILQAALQTGTVSLISERIQSMDLLENSGKWLLRTASGSWKFDAVVGADGVRSVVRRRLLGHIPREDLALAVGYMVSDVPLDEVVVHTYDDLLGYLWYFPRSDHATVGIGCKVGAIPLPELWRRLEGFLGRYFPQARKGHRWTALLPAVYSADFWKRPSAGQNWALIGDAAGHVNPINGMGIPYALASAQLVAQAILRDDLKSYDKAWRKEYGTSLVWSSAVMNEFSRSGDTSGFERLTEHMLGAKTPLIDRPLKMGEGS
jgi:flavin-dependent dehydrogenase